MNEKTELSLPQIVIIARMCHEMNRELCLLFGDTSQSNWEYAPDWQNKSAIAGVIFRLSNPDGPYSASHENWMKDKIADGWIYGETKDTEKKTHPCMVPYDQLPKEQQIKDKLFCMIVDAMKSVV